MTIVSCDAEDWRLYFERLGRAQGVNMSNVTRAIRAWPWESAEIMAGAVALGFFGLAERVDALLGRVDRLDLG